MATKKPAAAAASDDSYIMTFKGVEILRVSGGKVLKHSSLDALTLANLGKPAMEKAEGALKAAQDHLFDLRATK